MFSIRVDEHSLVGLPVVHAVSSGMLEAVFFSGRQRMPALRAGNSGTHSNAQVEELSVNHRIWVFVVGKYSTLHPRRAMVVCFHLSPLELPNCCGGRQDLPRRLHSELWCSELQLQNPRLPMDTGGRTSKPYNR